VSGVKDYTILIDLGGVLTEDPWETILLTPEIGIADRLGLDRDVVATAGGKLWELYCRSFMEEEQYWDQMSELLNIKLPPVLIQEIEKATLKPTHGALEFLSYLQETKRSWGLVTNNTAFWYSKQLAILGLTGYKLQWEFTSHDDGVVKSDTGRGLFEIAAETTDAANTLVIDDRLGNVVRARSAGFSAVQYETDCPISLIELVNGYSE